MSEFNFGVSTWLWTSPFRTETVNLFPKIKEMGFTHVEIPVEDPDIIDATVVKHALQQNDLKAIVCGAFGSSRDLTNDDVKIHNDCFQYIERCLELCNAWNASFLAGPMYSAVGKARLVDESQRKLEWDRAVKNLRIVCHMAEKRELTIAIEPLNRFESDLVNTCEDVIRLIDEIDHPSAKVLLDGFHMNIEEPSIKNAILMAGDKLIHFQVSENYRGTPGTGQTRWSEIFQALVDVGYTGVISIESFTPEIKELAGAVCVWKPLAKNQDDFASNGLSFLKRMAGKGMS